MHLKNSPIFLLLIFIYSCSDVKYIQRGNTMYKINTVENSDGNIRHELQIHKVQRNFAAKITETQGSLIIKPIEAALPTTFEVQPIVLGSNPDEGFHFPNASHKAGMTLIPNKFVYLDQKFFLQGLTVPVKIRPSLKDRSLKDSFPSQVETGFNVGLAFGVKFSKNVFRTEKNIFGQNVNRTSISPGFFMGTGAADLKKSNTRDPVIEFERRAPMISTGMFLMFGFNSINIGYTIGIDNALGRGSSTWLYQGKVWHGVSIGLDIIK